LPARLPATGVACPPRSRQAGGAALPKLDPKLPALDKLGITENMLLLPALAMAGMGGMGSIINRIFDKENKQYIDFHKIMFDKKSNAKLVPYPDFYNSSFI
jgi:hypothetical protein